MLNAPHEKSTVRSWFRLRGLSLAILLVGSLSTVLAPTPAPAIEIFGFKLFEPDTSDAIPIVDPLNYTVSVTIEGGVGGEELKQKLEAASTLVREQEKPANGSVGLISRANSDFEQLLGALYEDARYGGVVRISLAGRALANLPPDTDLSGQQPVPVAITVVPGPQFTLGTISIREESGMELDPATYGLTPGAPAYSNDILAAEGKVVDALRQLGKPLAKIVDRNIVADHDNNRLDVTLNVAAGPTAPFGPTSVDGAKDVDAAFIAYMAGVPEGETYDPDALSAAEKRLKSLDVFSSVAVRGDENLDAAGAVPVKVNVAERKFRYFGAGATFSTTDGGGLEAYWGHRNLFGRAEKLRVEGSVSGIGGSGGVENLEYRGALLFEKPGVLGPASTFTSSLEVKQEDLDAYRRFSVTADAGLKYQRNEQQTLSGAVEVEYAKTTDAFATNAETLTIALPLEFVHDARDDKLNPTTGYRLLAHLEPAYETYGGNTFVKAFGQVSAYRALDEAKRFVVAGRLAAGTIVGSDLAGIPSGRRFYAGGGGSVRGYGYQDVGPKNAAGDPTGGRSYMEASAELRFGITDTIGLVPFVDVGAVSADPFLQNARYQAGAGLGLRYTTPFGPLRVDVAVPLNRQPGDPRYGIYAGIGQAF